jgi:stage II sporulation protein M
MLTMPSEERRAYVRRLLPYISASLTLFASGVVLGVVAAYRIPGLADRFAETLANFVQMFSAMPPWKLAGAIFLNNAVKTLLAILLGTVMGFVPGIFLLANGVALGVAFSLSIQARGVWLSILAILPHGVLELPAVFLGTSIGLLLGMQTIKRLRGRSETAMPSELSRAVRFYCTVIVPMLLLAALVEAFITAAIISPR